MNTTSTAPFRHLRRADVRDTRIQLCLHQMPMNRRVQSAFLRIAQGIRRRELLVRDPVLPELLASTPGENQAIVQQNQLCAPGPEGITCSRKGVHGKLYVRLHRLYNTDELEPRRRKHPRDRRRISTAFQIQHIYYSAQTEAEAVLVSTKRYAALRLHFACNRVTYIHVKHNVQFILFLCCP